MLGMWGKYLRLWRDVALIFAVFRKWGRKDKKAKMIGNGFKFICSGGCKVKKCVGVIVSNWLIGKIVWVEKFNDRVIKINIIIWDVVWEVVSCYCPQADRSVNEKEEFYELMDKIMTSEKVLVGGW